MGNTVFRTLAIMLTLIAMGAGVGVFTARKQQAEQPPQIQGLLWPEPRKLAGFSVVDQDNAEFGLQDMRGKWSFLFFGYTNCPDICPITLSVFNQLYEQLRADGIENEVQMIFVSVDPERDNTQQIREYVSYFNREFIGLGGRPEQIEQLTRQIGIAFFRQEAGEDGSYLVDHSASIFLVDPDARLLAILSAPHNAEDLHSRFQSIRAFLARQS